MTRAYDGDSRFRQDLWTPAHIKDKWRVVNFAQAWRVARIVDGDYGYSRPRCVGDFFARQFAGLSSRYGLRGNHLDPRAFELGERGAEYGFGRAEMFDQLAAASGAESLRESESEPLQQVRGGRRYGEG